MKSKREEPDELLLDVVAEHAEESAILWELRQGVVVAPSCRLSGLDELDERIDAHLDGLRVAGAAGRETCRAGLEQAGAGEVFAAAAVALAFQDQAMLSLICDIVTAAPALSRGLISALGWIGSAQGDDYAAQLRAAAAPVLQRTGLVAFAIQRKTPPGLSRALSSPDVRLRARALRCVGELGQREWLPQVRSNLADDDLGCRFWAAWAATLFGDESGREVLHAFALAASPDGDVAVDLLMAVLPRPDATALYQQITLQPGLARRAVRAAGAHGRIGVVESLIECMSSAELARPAGEAFTLLTGLEIVGGLELDRSGVDRLLSSATRDNEEIELDPDENLVYPNAKAVAESWNRSRNQFSEDVRYFLGEPVGKSSLQSALREGSQRQRRRAALELAALIPGSLLFETRAPAFRQVEAMRYGLE